VRATCSGRGDTMKISGTIRNVGRFDSNIERATFQWPASPEGSMGTQPRRLSSEVRDDYILGLKLPMPLPGEAGSEFSIINLRDVDLGLAVALHDRRAVTLTFHTASGRKGSGKVRYAQS
jgi:hypothetical protein